MQGTGEVVTVFSLRAYIRERKSTEAGEEGHLCEEQRQNESGVASKPECS